MVNSMTPSQKALNLKVSLANAYAVSEHAKRLPMITPAVTMKELRKYRLNGNC